MPILEVDLTGGVAAPARAGLARRIADAAGVIFGSAPGETWVRVREVPHADYGAKSRRSRKPSQRRPGARAIKCT